MSNFGRVLHLISISAKVGAISTIALDLFFLGCVYWIYRNPISRPAINRLSFRLLLYIAVTELVYASMYLFMYADNKMIFRLGRNVIGCSASMAVISGCRLSINYLFSCIAINLMLVICFDVKPATCHLEKIYVATSFFAGFLPPILGASLGHYGSLPDLPACFYSGELHIQRLRHMILDLWTWQVCSALIAAISVVPVIAMFVARRKRATNLLLRELPETDALSDESDPRTAQRWSRRSTVRSDEMSAPLHQFADRLMSTSLRILAYPLALILTNGTTIAGDWYFFEHIASNDTQFGFFAFYILMYSGRGVIFTLYSIFGDLCLRKGFKALRVARDSARSHQTATSVDPISPRTPRSRLESIPVLLGNLSPSPKAVTIPLESPESEMSFREFFSGKTRSDGAAVALHEPPLELGLEITPVPVAEVPATERVRYPRLWNAQRSFSDTRGGVRPGGADIEGQDAVDWSRWTETSSMPTARGAGLELFVLPVRNQPITPTTPVARPRVVIDELAQVVARRFGELERRL